MRISEKSMGSARAHALPLDGHCKKRVSILYGYPTHENHQNVDSKILYPLDRSLFKRLPFLNRNPTVKKIQRMNIRWI